MYSFIYNDVIWEFVSNFGAKSSINFYFPNISLLFP